MKQLLIFATLLIVSTGVAHADTCVVSDPTGTPLNVRDQPSISAPILGALNNGVVVSTGATHGDWVRVVPQEGRSGWVYRKYLNCRAQVTQLGTVEGWKIEYDSELFAGACIAAGQYKKTKYSFLTAYPREGTEKLWFFSVSNPEWTWIKKDTDYELILATQKRNDPRRDRPVTFRGFDGQFMVAAVNVDIVNSMATDYSDIQFNIRNPKNNEWLSKKESFPLGKSAAAIRAAVNCLRDRAPIANAPPPRPETSPPSQPKREGGLGFGTGFYVSKKFGTDYAYVVTNAHAIHRCRKLNVKYAEYRAEDAFLAATDYPNDLALLTTKLSATAFPRFRLNLRLGESVASYGFPYGNDFASFTTGNVTSVVGLKNNTSEFQMSAPVQPGNSGGPILDTNGRVLGMSQGVLGTLGAAEALGGAVPQNVNFAITSTTIVGFLQAHSVDYRVDTGGAKLEPEQIAEEAKKFTVQIMCEK
jgi:serine protease Do